MASQEDLAFFRAQQQKDPESKVCFECRASNPQWCDVWHGIYICLECSGTHRSLGTHISFVRSLSMDAWQPEKLQLMKVGGNGKARAFFRAHGVKDDLPIREKYATDAAYMYKDKLAAEAAGKAFSEAEWKPPERQQRQVTQYDNARSEPGFGNSRYQGIGAPTNNQKQADVLGDAGAILSRGWANFSSAVSEAATVAATKSREMAATASESAPGIQKATAEGWSSLTGKTKAGWTGFTSWASSLASNGGGETDGFNDMLANVERTKSTQFSSVSSKDQSGATNVGASGNNNSGVVTRPSSNSVNSRNGSRTGSPVPTTTPVNIPITPNSAPTAVSDDWQWGDDDDNQSTAIPKSPDSGPTSRKKGLGAQRNSALGAAKRTTIARKAD